ncbi:outer membrane protein assembly factor BamB [Undibacterium sp. CY18W]|uniref:Outer membrane protein assembly factor BamB n=1 Tax=Undibacterium hunanense TaxID=2762292 RepID=A0ABR6ZNB0_9BURK|nr:outer membrane protein assembly factor BamB [Undibacterium hunanense]MBC3917380.1 outer membrane protein assembly factor BamB [Undibacterium hunanense]
MQFSAKLLVTASALFALSGCSTLSSLNPFSSKSEKNTPAVLTDIKTTMSIKASWTVPVGAAGNYLFTPASLAQNVYAAAADGTLIRVEVASGRTVWKINAGMRLTAGVGVDAGTIAVVGEKGQLLAFDLDGKLRWKTPGTNEILSAPAVGQGLVVVRSIDNKISAYDVNTGERKWSVERPLPPLTLRLAPGIVITEQQVLVALPGGRMSSLALNNGGLRWEAVVGEPKGATELERVADVSGIPVILGRDVCASSFQGRVACFDVGTGALRWNKNLSSEVGVSVDERFVFAADVNGAVNAYARTGGASAWRNDKLSNRRLSAPISFDRAVAVGDLAGYVHFLSREDGSFIGRVTTDGSQILAAPLVVDAKLIVQTKSGSLVALAAE